MICFYGSMSFAGKRRSKRHEETVLRQLEVEMSNGAGATPKAQISFVIGQLQWPELSGKEQLLQSSHILL